MVKCQVSNVTCFLVVIGIDASRANRVLKTGTEWYSFVLIEQLKTLITPDSGHRVFLYTNTPLLGTIKECPNHVEERVLRWWPGKLWTQLRLSWEMVRRSPDVLFIPAHAIPLVHPRRTVVTIHDIGFERLPALYPWYDRLYHRIVVRFALRRAWRVIVPSECTKQEIVEVYGIEPGRISVVHHGYDRRYASKEPAASSRKQDYFLFVGRLEKKKNIVGLLRAFAAYREAGGDHRLVLAGKPGFGFEEIQSVIRDLRCNDAVEFRGWVSPEGMRGLMQSATAFVFPSLYEGFGLPVLEAFAAGVPVIASAIPALREVAGDAALFVPPYRVDMLVHALHRIARHAELRASLIARGQERLQNFSWDRAAQTTFALLTDAVVESEIS